METKTIESVAVWVHVSSGANGMARWAKGAARKGNRDGKTHLSAILFNSEEIAADLEGKTLIGASLALNRDAAYGTDAVSVCVAPARIDRIGEVYMSRDGCLELARRELHKCHTVSEDTAVFKLPGATLLEIAAGNVNAFLIYQEEDGTGSFIRMSDAASLVLYLSDSEIMESVWTRTVSAGDAICSRIRSHVADLREIWFYINLRRALNSLTALPERTYGPFEKWAEHVAELQAGMDEVLIEEGIIETGETYDWTVPAAGEMPNAGIIEQLKSVVKGSNEGQSTAVGYTTMQQLTTISEPYSVSKKTAWTAAETLKAGKYRKQHTQYGADGVMRTITLWETSVCGWLISGIPEEATAADLEIILKASETQVPHITLYGLIADAAPTGVNTSYQEVFGATVIGEADCPVGEATRIHLTSQGLNAIRAGTLTGAGIRYDNQYVEIANQAVLVTNAGEGEGEE